jgi:uncharacterized DUF497 family protein
VYFVRFEWDPLKNSANIVKHQVSFEDATTVFDDKDAIYLKDELHSGEEDRFYIIGVDSIKRILTVCHCYRNGDDVVRIISAWRAGVVESKFYIERSVAE